VVAVRTAQEKDVFSVVNDAAVTNWCDVGEMTWMSQVAAPRLGAFHDSMPNTLGMAVLPLGKYAALNESVLPDVSGLATVLIPFSHKWSAYWLLWFNRNDEALNAVVLAMLV